MVFVRKRRVNVGELKVRSIAKAGGFIGGVAATAPVIVPRLPMAARVVIAGGSGLAGFALGGLAAGLAIKEGRRIFRRKKTGR